MKCFYGNSKNILDNIEMERVSNKGLIIFTVSAIALVLAYFIIFFQQEDFYSNPLKGLGLILLFASVPISLVAYHHYRKASRISELLFEIDRQPVLPAGRAIGGVPYAVEGIIIADKTLIAPLSKKECVYHHSIKERDQNGWKLWKNIVEYVPFYIEDKSGRIRVDMKGMDRDFSHARLSTVDYIFANSEVDALPTLDKKVYRVHKRFLPDERWRATEHILEPRQKVFAYGMVFRDSEKYLGESAECPLIISRKRKSEFVESFSSISNLNVSTAIMVVGLIMFIVGLNLIYALFSLLALIILTVAIVAHSFYRYYNLFIILSERIKNSRSELDIQFKKRAELIPGLVEIARSYSKHEGEINALIARIRRDLSFYPLGEDKRKKLIGILEGYPELKADRNFKSLMFSLEKIERSIAQTREFYNRSVLRYNDLCQKFPGVIVAKLIGRRPKTYDGAVIGQEDEMDREACRRFL